MFPFEWGGPTCRALRGAISSLPTTSNSQKKEQWRWVHWDSLKRAARLQSRWKFPAGFSFRENLLASASRTAQASKEWQWELHRFFFFFLPIEIVVKLYNGMRIRELMRKAKRRYNGLTSLRLFLASCPLVFFPVCWGVCEYHLAGGTRTEESVAALPHPYSPARFYLTVEKHYLHPFLLYHLFVTGLFIKSQKSPI